MLPLPVSLTRREFHRHAYHSRRSTRDILLTRARVTNLGFLLLAGFAAISFLLNLRWYFSSLSTGHQAHVPPLGILATIERHDALSAIDHLIIVPGHAIWKGSSIAQRLDDDEWILEPYQRGGARVAAFFKHILAGAELAREDENSLLIFTGGQTRPSSTTTEAESYMRLALLSDVLPTDVPSRVLRATTENYALDSYQNLLFSVARFHEYTGRYPKHITVVGYEMKRRRFTELHRIALRWFPDRFHYIGIDAEGDEALAAREGERVNGFLPYTMDAYGCHGLLLSKRRSRNPFIRYHSYYSSSPELGDLLNWCPGPDEGGQTAIFAGPLPWDYT